MSNHSTDAVLDRIHLEKYRDPHQSREEHSAKLATNLSSNHRHRDALASILINDRFLPAGRVQAAGGSSRNSSYFNCIVSGTIEDSMESIGDKLKESLMTLRLGSGIGYDFSKLRPKGAFISTLKSAASGPISFMEVFDAGCRTIHMSHRRGAQMGVMRIDHPDIEAFIDAKLENKLSAFNLSVAVTDEFMEALQDDDIFWLKFNGERVKHIPAWKLWRAITTNAYNSAEPGVLFIDTINKQNNLYYCEEIAATNPCAEQPLPPYGACLLGSFNLTGYLRKEIDNTYGIDFDLFHNDIREVVEAYDNIFERSIYALPQHREEAQSKRRIGLGLTGISNAIELLEGKPCYGSNDFSYRFETIAMFLRDSAYYASIRLAAERGSFHAYAGPYLEAPFIKSLPEYLQSQLRKYGIRNSHLISYAPCGTISLAHGNLSSGIEPVFYPTTTRKVLMNGGPAETFTIKDFAVNHYGFTGKTLEHCTTEDHLRVHEVAQRYCDSAVSKTINMPASTTLEEYQSVWLDAYKRGAKGLTVYRPNDIRPPIISNGDCDNGECKLSLVA